jgi:hypothetical protein
MSAEEAKERLGELFAKVMDHVEEHDPDAPLVAAILVTGFADGQLSVSRGGLEQDRLSTMFFLAQAILRIVADWMDEETAAEEE